jgi:hypothetical protein
MISFKNIIALVFMAVLACGVRGAPHAPLTTQQ